MARVPYVDRESLDPITQAIHDRIREERNSPKVGRQFLALLHSPKATGHLASMGAELRFNSALPEDLKELAILVVAREWNSEIEWTSHSTLAARANVSAQSIEAVRTRTAPEGLTNQERIVATLLLQLLRTKSVLDDDFAAAHALLGTRGVVELTLTCSYYSALCLAQLVLKPELEPGRVSTL